MTTDYQRFQEYRCRHVWPIAERTTKPMDMIVVKVYTSDCPGCTTGDRVIADWRDDADAEVRRALRVVLGEREE